MSWRMLRSIQILFRETGENVLENGGCRVAGHEKQNTKHSLVIQGHTLHYIQDKLAKHA